MAIEEGSLRVSRHSALSATGWQSTQSRFWLGVSHRSDAFVVVSLMQCPLRAFFMDTRARATLVTLSGDFRVGG